MSDIKPMGDEAERDRELIAWAAKMGEETNEYIRKTVKPRPDRFHGFLCWLMDRIYGEPK